MVVLHYFVVVAHGLPLDFACSKGQRLENTPPAALCFGKPQLLCATPPPLLLFFKTGLCDGGRAAVSAARERGRVGRQREELEGDQRPARSHTRHTLPSHRRRRRRRRACRCARRRRCRRPSCCCRRRCRKRSPRPARASSPGPVGRPGGGSTGGAPAAQRAGRGAGAPRAGARPARHAS